MIDIFQSSVVQLLLGLILLVVGGEILVRGAVNIARRFKISTLVVGSTIVALGTSMPELIVSVNASLSNHSEIALGNVLGSNIANIGCVLGLTAIARALPVTQDTIRIGWPIMMLGSVLLWFFCMNGQLSAYQGVIFLAILVFYILASIKMSKKSKEASEILAPTLSLPISILLLIGASVGLGFGSNFLISGASSIATNLGISERVISLTIVAFGTSLPEIVASLIAAFKNETELAIGNIIGSNIFNILGILGITSIISPIDLDIATFSFDFYSVLIISGLLILFVYPVSTNRILIGEKKKPIGIALLNLTGGVLRRWEGALLFVLYIAYNYMLF